MTDKDSCGAQPPHNGSPEKSLSERFVHYSCIRSSKQVPNREAVPKVRLMEIGLLRRSGIC